MRSLLKVFKPNSTLSSNEVVMISDLVLPASDEEQTLAEGEEASQSDGGSGTQEDGLHPVASAEEIAFQRAKEMAEELSAKILRAARDERDAILEQAHTESTHLFAQAKQEGFQAAYQELQDQIQECILNVSSTLDELQHAQQQFIQEYEKNLCFLAVDIAEKALNKKIEQNDLEMMELVKQAVSSVKNADWISVEISDKLQGLMEKLKVEFANQAGGSSIELSGIDAPIGTCIVHTDESVLDASVSVQMQNARELFEKM